MAGKIKNLIDQIIEQRAKGNKSIEANIKIKMILKGIFPDNYNALSDDDPKVLEKLNLVAEELGINAKI